MANSVSFEVFIYLQVHVTAVCWGGVQRKGVLWMGYRAFRFSGSQIPRLECNKDNVATSNSFLPVVQ